MLSQIQLGDIASPAGIVFLDDLPSSDSYVFQISQPGVVSIAATDVRLAFDSLDRNDFRLALTADVPGAGAIGSIGTDVGNELIQISLPAGGYHILVDGIYWQTFDLILTADTAPGLLVTSGPPGQERSDPSALTKRNLQTLSTANTVDIHEYVGLGSGNVSNNVFNDFIDAYSFNVVKQGDVKITLDTFATNDNVVNLRLLRDFDGDGVFQLGTAEEIAALNEIELGLTKEISKNLSPGSYGVVVTPGETVPTIAQQNHYRMRINYKVADGAGNSLGKAAIVGTVGNSLVTFNDYISPNDANDVYKFTTVAGGPFVFSGTLSGMAPGSNFQLDFIRDLDEDGAVDLFEAISSTRTGNGNENLEVAFDKPGTYFVRVRRETGEGVYQLQFLNRNQDLAGNSLPTARNFGELFGFVEFIDRVSPSDTGDIYKFKVPVQFEFNAQLGAMPSGTGANLFLIRDSDGDGVIDPGETIAASSKGGNANEFISVNLTAGTYFVRVDQAIASPTYELRLVKDAVGDSLGAALPLSQGGGQAFDFLGPEDDLDVYKFTLGTARRLGVVVGQNNEPVLIRAGRDKNNNGVLDQAETLLSEIAPAGEGAFEQVNLEAGVNFVLISAVVQDRGTNYDLTLFNQKPDHAGNSLSEARELGELNGTQSFSDFVGDGSVDLLDDLNDVYRFALGDEGPYVFVAALTNLTGNANLQLIRDDNLNDQIDAGEIIGATNIPGTGTDVIQLTLLRPGIHYLRVFRAAGQADYSMSMTAASLDTAGNSLNDPAILGPIDETLSSTNHFVGLIDLDDFFKFSVPKRGEIDLELNSDGGPPTFQVIRNINNDSIVDPGEILATSPVPFADQLAFHGIPLPSAGDYFLRVIPDGGDRTYEFEVSFSPQFPFVGAFELNFGGATEIKAVRFDIGGDGISYRDTTAGNSGNEENFRAAEEIDVDVSNTTDQLSGGRRVTNTAPTEFLEYTLNVIDGGLYDFDARVSSPNIGASFHLEIDGEPISGSVSIPDTDNEDNMVTVPVATFIPLSLGPHVLRLVIDTGTGVNNDFAGSFNFILARPAFTGTFQFTPATSTVEAWDRTNLSLDWTVPVGGWRTLDQVDLRLRRDDGKLFWIRFDEACNSMSLFNEATGKFGPTKQVGSGKVLSNSLAKVYLKKTTVKANGPDSPTVVITLELKFKGAGRGHYTIDAAASDDFGHHDPFQFAGTIDVI